MKVTTAATRRLDPAESYFWFMDQVSPMTFTAIAEGRGPLSVDALTLALARAQREHAMLRARLVADTQGWLHFEWTQAPPISVRVVDVGPNWRDSFAEAAHPSFEVGTAPLVRALLLRLEQARWVFALAFHHSVADGRSGCQLLAEVLRNAGNNGLPETKRPTPAPMHERLGVTSAPSTVEDFRVRRRRVLERYGPLDALPDFECRLAPAIPRFESLTFEPGFLDKLAARCRANNTTVHGALGAAQLLAVRSAFAGPSPRTLALTSPCDLRPAVADADAEGPSLCTTLLGGPYRVEDGAFWPLAREVVADLKSWLGQGDGPLFFSFFPPRPALPGEIDAFRNEALQRPQGSVLSNLGRLRDVDLAGDLRVDAMSFVLFPNVTQSLFTAVTSYGSTLHLNVCYAAARLPSPLATKLVSALDANLRDAAS